MRKNITITSKYEYAGQDEQLQTVPYGNINKTICGCGLTTVAIESNENVIIAVPTTYLVSNKTEQYPISGRCSYRLLAVDGKVSMCDIDNYINGCIDQPIKIITTYDSVHKLEEYLNICRLIIDESDSILPLTKEKERRENILKMMNIAEKYKDEVSFISATPIKLKYLPDWISKIPQVLIRWENTTKSIPILFERTYPYKSLREEIIKPLQLNKTLTISDKTFSSVIVFLNSIDQITDIIKTCELDKNECRIICGNTLKNDLRIRGIDRYSVGDEFKYLFVTKSGYSGIDITSDDAMTIIVSNTRKEWLMTDVNTDLKQAVSRQRLKNNPNYGYYIYIYNQTIFNLSEEEMIEQLNEKKIKVLQGIELYELAKKHNKTKGWMTNSDFDSYTTLNEDKDVYIFNESAFNADMYFLLEIRKQYTKGFDIKSNFDDSKTVDLNPIIVDSTITYSNLVEYFNVNHHNGKVKWNEYSYKNDWINIIETSYRLYKRTFKNITRAKYMINNYGDDWKLLKGVIKSMFKKGVYSRKEITEKLQQLYDENNIQRIAKYSDIYETIDINNTREKKIKGERYIEILK